MSVVIKIKQHCEIYYMYYKNFITVKRKLIQKMYVGNSNSIVS